MSPPANQSLDLKAQEADDSLGICTNSLSLEQLPRQQRRDTPLSLARQAVPRREKLRALCCSCTWFQVSRWQLGLLKTIFVTLKLQRHKDGVL